MKKSEAKDANDSGKTKLIKASGEDRNALLSAVWGSKKSSRLNQIIHCGYCGRLTVRELASIVLADRINFPNGLDTPMCIGDFEGNFCTNMLSISLRGVNSDHICVMGDPHETMM